MIGTYLAHSANDGGAGVSEPLKDHLQAVAERAEEFATWFGAAEQARAAGLLHDLGKYADRFQLRLRDPRQRAGDHWSIGAALLAGIGRELGLLPAFAAAGHHTGLPSLSDNPEDFVRPLLDAFRSRSEDFTDTNKRLLLERFLADGFALPSICTGLRSLGQFAADMLDVRMLFSALVDADFLETEAHFNGDAHTPRRPRPRGPSLDLEKAIAALHEYLGGVRQKFQASPMAGLREMLFEQCLEAASQPTGLFSLSAPTGSGKTLAMLALALYHAKARHLRRIVLVMPFLNIIEQTAEIYREIFSAERGFEPNTVLEHHSLAEHDESRMADAAGGGPSARLLAENWDAPILLTTSVQFFESLMADRPSRCRKLHRLAHSVILFDEVQTLPVGLAVATLATLARLSDPTGPYRSTFIFATATQPAFEVLDQRVRTFASCGWQPREVVRDVRRLFAAAVGRVGVTWRHETAIDLDEVASELASHDRVLAIVNLKRHAVHLATTLRDRGTKGLFHLSTNMCPAHRTAVLSRVNRRLSKGQPVRLVATQCVEAGVDLDFPVVYRALAPLEAIAQAAGRCNRHGSGAAGRVVVFKPRDGKTPYPPGYKEAVNATEIFLAGLTPKGGLDKLEILGDPDRLRAYFRQFYDLSGRACGELQDEEDLLKAIREGDFAKTAELYRLIRQDAIQVVVPYDREVFDELRSEIRSGTLVSSGVIGDWFRRAAPHMISLYRPDLDDEIWNLLDPVTPGRFRPVDRADTCCFTATDAAVYDQLLGLQRMGESCWIA